jgi:amino acid adenylation domain-containing protein
MSDDSSRIAGLSPAKRALLEQRLRERDASTPNSPQQSSGQQSSGLSFAQERLWVLAELTPGLSAYNTTRVVRMNGTVDAERLRSALRAVMQRHHVLRTHVRADGDGIPQAIIGPGREPVVEITTREDEQAALDVVSEFADRPFDLAHDDLLRALLVRVPGGDLLALSLHHIASDEGSRRVLWHDLSTAYAGKPLAPLEFQYADFARRQRTEFDQPSMQKSVDWWVHHLGSAPQVINLPTDSRRPHLQSYRGARYRQSLRPETVASLRALARESGATLFMTVLAGFNWLLRSWAQTEDVVVGLPVSGRDTPGSTELIGPLVNTVVVRSDCSGEPTFAELLGRTRAAMLSSLEHQSVPFDKVVEAVAPARDLSRNPLFQVLVNAITIEQEDDFTFGDLHARVIVFDPGTTKFDLGLLVAERPDSTVDLVFEYAADLFEEHTVATLLERLQGVLAAACADPTAPLNTSSIVTPGERERLLRIAGRVSTTSEQTTLDLIRARCEATPQAVAIGENGEPALTYAVLWERSQRLAEAIARHVERGALVGIAVPRGPDLVVAALAVWRAGCAYVPIDTDYPADRIEYMIGHSGAALVLRDADPDGVEASLNANSDVANTPARTIDDTTPEDLAYVIYTSGSTGQPKGVAIGHRALANLLTAFVAEPGITAGDTLLALTTFSFDIAGLELFAPLVAGGTVVVATRTEASDPVLLADLIKRSEATIVQATPSTYRMLIDQDWAGEPGLRVLCGGEALSGDLAAQLLPRVGEVWNCYGPTETTIWSTLSRVEDPSDITIGRPIANTIAYVLDAGLRLVPPGTQGELWLGGTGLAQGYLHRDDLTQERFVEDPFRPGHRIYRTGDVAVWTANDELRCLGRTDNQIKLRGYRIELGEIDAAITAAANVRDAVVVLHNDSPNDASAARLVAYVVGSADGLADHLRSRLPSYMVPTFFVELEAIPRLPNGKTDRSALPAPERSSRADGDRVRKPPTTRAELKVAAVWSALLGEDAPSVDDDFFAAGGHSLLAARLAARLGESFGRVVELRQIFETPTLSALAAALDGWQSPERAHGEPASLPVTLDRGRRRISAGQLADRLAMAAARDGESTNNDGELAVFPMSSGQERMWLLEQMTPGDPRYLVPVLRWVDGDIEIDQLEKAFGEVVARHEILRTTYHQLDDVLVQVVHPADAARRVSVIVQDAPTKDDALAAARDELSTRFDLSSGPSVRVRQWRIPGADDAAPSTALLAVYAHHISIDGWSIDRLVNELDAYVSGAVRPDTLQFGDYATWERARGTVAEDRAFWHAQLAGAPAETGFPLSHPRTVDAIPQGRRLRQVLSPELARAVTAVCQETRTTPFMLLCAAVSALLTRHGGERDAVIGTPFATRSFPGSEAMIGPLFNPLALRFDVDLDLPFREHLDRVARVCTDAYRHGNYPFDRLVSELDVPRDASRHPMFQVLVAMQDASESVASLGEASLTPVEIDWHVARYDVLITLARSDGSLELLMEYRSDLIDDQVADWMLPRMLRFIESATAQPDVSLGALAIVGDDEAAALRRFGGTEESTSVPLLSALVASIAAEHPDLQAIRVNDDEVSFGGLVKRAEAIAEVLRSNGVKRGDRVAVATGHSAFWPCAIFGVWAANAVYVPLDPNYPQARHEFLLEDSESRIVLTDSVTAGSLTTDLPIVVVDDLIAPHNPESSGLSPLSSIQPADQAYLIYTSGSTGKPKGVKVRHEMLAHYMDAVRRFIYADTPEPGARVAVNASISFDPSLRQLLHLGYGQTICPIPDGVRLDPPQMVTYLDKLRVDVFDATPTHMQLLMGAGLLRDGTGPKVVILSGEAVDADLWRALSSSASEAWNLYGPTEATVDVVATRINGDGPPVMGEPLPATVVRVVDPAEQLVPVGVSGELWISGPQVTDGYLGRPELTAERFVMRDGRRWYRSGDVVRYRADGAIEYLGRADDQVKIRGNRVELGEVAMTLRNIPGIRDAAAVASEGQLIGAVVLEDGSTLTATAIRHHMLERVPAFLVPARLVAVDTLPQLTSGKLDRAAIISAVSSSAAGGLEEQIDEATVEPPSGPAEELIAELWSELLNVPVNSADDNFFDLGGDSLSASRFVSQLRAMDLDLPLMTVFTHPTVRGLAEPLTTILLGTLSEPSTDR